MATSSSSGPDDADSRLIAAIIPLGLFRLGDFRCLGVSMLFNAVGMMGEVVVLGWLTLELTNSPFIVGVAMGTGADVALESAGVTLLKGDLGGIVRARRLSAATMANIRQNLFFAFIYNAAGVPLAAGVLYPVLGVLLSPIIAAAAMALSSVSVIANALRLRTQAL